MIYPLIPIGLIALFIVYMLYLLLIKKDKKQLKMYLPFGIAFTALWSLIYYLFFR